MHNIIRLSISLFAILLLNSSFSNTTGAKNQLTRNDPAGRIVYDYYCYQCHGYTGNAQTIASRYLTPKPRDFTANSPRILSREAMLDAVRNGRPGTAMVGFGNVLSRNEIEAVVEYVREYLMKNKPLTKRYHTGANSWPDHDRFSNAFPFVNGTLPLQRPWGDLNEHQRAGKRIYLSACITCHDAGAARTDPIWELRIVSYPPMRYSHETDSSEPAAATSIHPRHETPTPAAGLSLAQHRGRRLYLDNCAHCHAPDGSAQNWVGGFLEPHARDFRTGGVIAGKSTDHLRTLIGLGITGTSMPAWRGVLNTMQIEEIIDYLQQAFGQQALGRNKNVIPIRIPDDAKSSVTSPFLLPSWRVHPGKPEGIQ